MKPVVAMLALLLAGPALAEKTEGVIPGVLFGPKLGIVSFPAPSVGVEAKLGGWFGLSYDYGWVPELKVKEVRVGWTNWSAGAKVFPFHGSFFLGALYGQRSLRLRRVDDSTGVAIEARGRVTSSYLAPELGWRFIGNTGFTMGIDLGWQFVTGHSAHLTVPLGYDAEKEKDVRDFTDRVGKAGIPVLGLLQLGWMF